MRFFQRLSAFGMLCLSLILLGSEVVKAFAPCSSVPTIATLTRCTPSKKFHVLLDRQYSIPYSTVLFESNKEDEEQSNTLLQRFTDPIIDDPGLPLTDILIAQIVAPTLQIYWIVFNHAPTPSWLLPISSYFGSAPELAPRGSFLAPALIHGAGLAVCWMLGALAAKGFERDAFTLKGSKRASVFDNIGRYDNVIKSTVKAGAFASGVLIFGTQIDLLLEFGRYVQFGESEEIDLRLLVAAVEVINDIVFEAAVITSWRLIHANFMSTPQNRSREF